MADDFMRGGGRYEWSESVALVENRRRGIYVNLFTLRFRLMH
jgi:hypothetical protein